MSNINCECIHANLLVLDLMADSTLARGVLCQWLRFVAVRDDGASPTRAGAWGGTCFRFGTDIICSRARGGVVDNKKEREQMSELVIRSGVGLIGFTTNINNV